MAQPGMQNLNDTEPGGLLSEADFDALLHKPWPIVGAGQQLSRIQRLSETGHRLVPWIAGAIGVGLVGAILFGSIK
jgi:hypothetical protein